MHTGRRATQTIVPQKELVCFAIGPTFGLELTKYVGLVGWRASWTVLSLPP